jgi:hypothetical protein
MQSSYLRIAVLLTLLGLLTAQDMMAQAQVQNETVTTRGRLWETISNDGWIGSLGAWDYLVATPLGLFPGFQGYRHPVGSEFNAINTFANANMHNFRSGVWIAVKDMTVPGTPPGYAPTPADFEVFLSGHQNAPYGAQSVRDPIVRRQNFIESPDYDPTLPEEYTEATWNTNTGLTITRRSYVWSFPGFSDFIIYDYVFKNTGNIVSPLTGVVVPNFPQQTLRDVYFGFHSGIAVSTKSQINFYCELTAVQAGSFGWLPPSYHDFYHESADGTLMFSYNYDGGQFPPPWNPYCVKGNQAWRQEQRFGVELMSPAAFGWLALHATPISLQGQRATARPDVRRIDVHKGGLLGGRALDLEFFRLNSRPKSDFHAFLREATRQEQLGNNGNRMNFFTLSYGPYTIPPAAEVRIVLAEIAGVMDYNEIVRGDPEGMFPDSTIAAIYRNAENARRAVQWGLGATTDGMPLAAAVPSPPPAPDVDAVNASVGTERAVIAVTWDRASRDARIMDGGGNLFFDGSRDIDGYRIYRSRDFQYVSETQPPVMRGAAWSLLVDIPVAEVQQYWNDEVGRYLYEDESVDFGFSYSYYVAAYRNQSGSWTAPNGTVVTNLGPMESGSVRRTPATSARPGPVDSFDIYAVPNPFVFGEPGRTFGRNEVQFRNLPRDATIRIYGISGDLIRVLEHGADARGNVSGSIEWDLTSDSGLMVAPGLYIYHVQSRTEGLDRAFTGKVMIIR